MFPVKLLKFPLSLLKFLIRLRKWLFSLQKFLIRLRKCFVLFLKFPSMLGYTSALCYQSSLSSLQKFPETLLKFPFRVTKVSFLLAPSFSLWLYSCRSERSFTANAQKKEKRYFQICKLNQCYGRLIKCLLSLGYRDTYYRKNAFTWTRSCEIITHSYRIKWMGDFHFDFVVHVLFSLLWNFYPGPAVHLPICLSLSLSNFIATALKDPSPPIRKKKRRGIFKSVN